MKLTCTAVAASLALVTTSVAGQQTEGTTGKWALEDMKPEAVFTSWDSNRNNELTKQEFATGLQGQNWFQAADSDNNGRISKSEFKISLRKMNVHRRADLNNNGQVEQQEAKRLLGNNQAAQWNTQQPASLSEEELYDGLYAAWSKDGAAGLTHEEALAGAFECADRDDNGTISKAEFVRDVALMKGDASSKQSRRDGSGSDRAVGTSGAVAAATVEAIVDNPDAYIGDHVTVSGDVGDVFGARVFDLEEHGVIDVDDELIVVAPKGAARMTEDASVQVRGTVRRVVTRDLELEYGPYWTHWGVDRDFFTTRESRPVLFAETIDVRR